MSQPAQWTAYTAAEALDILNAATQKIEAGLLAAYPGKGFADRSRAAKNTQVSLTIAIDISALDQVSVDRSALNEQVRGDQA